MKIYTIVLDSGTIVLVVSRVNSIICIMRFRHLLLLLLLPTLGTSVTAQDYGFNWDVFPAAGGFGTHQDRYEISWTLGEVFINNSTSVMYTFSAGFQQVLGSNVIISTQEISLEDIGIKVFPNPVFETLHIIQEDLGREIDIRILDIKGVAVLSASTSSNRFLIGLETLPRGQYLVEFRVKDLTISHKLIKH